MTVESKEDFEEETKDEIKEEEDSQKQLDTFPTMKELRYHEWILKNPRPPWVMAKIRTRNLNNVKFSCMIGYFDKKQAYLDTESPINVMSMLHYNWIKSERMGQRMKPSNPGKICSFVGRVNGLKVFVGNFTCECDFMVLEDTTSVIDHDLGLYLMIRTLKVLRKFHWMILEGRFNQLLHVSSLLLSKQGGIFFSLYPFLRVLLQNKCRGKEALETIPSFAICLVLKNDGAKVTEIKESKDLTSLSLDELIDNLKVHKMIIKKDFEIVKAEFERKSLALKAKKESSNEECLNFGSKEKEYAMAVRDFKKFFKRRGRFVRQPQNNKRCFKEAVTTKTVKVIESAFDAATRIILLENVQNHRKIRTKEPLSKALGAIAVKKMMKRSKTKCVL
uniref:Protein kinase-like domain, concanavalin A-like lectin/glucanase domain protein n=1 Tax=Tanacetum cinerariifolium TaxID=118510 RepID=A0A699GK73_TANCI|nr:protein kinase-like domain, concanavalin A-like lectin/glucanase domain protein [Tanacetum cinerariifolium]